MKAHEILNAAAGHMQDRASTYDKPEGERSMGRAVAALNAITGRDLTEAEGWLLLQLLKSVRLFTRPGFHRDSAEDAVAYAALMGEAKSAEAIDHALRVAGQAADLLAGCRDAAEKFIAEQDVVSLISEGVADADAGRVTPLEEVKARRQELWTEDDERRMDVVAQNGNDGAAYAGKGPCLGCGGPHPLHRCGRDRPTGEDESQ